MTFRNPSVKHILVPTDFSDDSRAAVDQAVWLARKGEADVTLVHALNDLRHATEALPEAEGWSANSGDFNRAVEELKRSSDARLEKLAGRYAKTGVSIGTRTVVGKAFAQVVHGVCEVGFDLVVVGTRGTSGLKRFLVGSTAQRLIQHCPCPVWVVRKDAKPKVSTVLVAVDFSDASRAAVKRAGELALTLKARLHLVHVVDDADLRSVTERSGGLLPKLSRKDMQAVGVRRLDEMVAGLISPDLETERHVAHGDPWRMIATAAKRTEADVVVMGTVGRGGVSGILLGSTAERVLATVSCGVLAVKPEGFVTTVEAAMVSQWK
jgi:universal stress protein E